MNCWEAIYFQVYQKSSLFQRGNNFRKQYTHCLHTNHSPKYDIHGLDTRITTKDGQNSDQTNTKNLHI